MRGPSTASRAAKSRFVAASRALTHAASASAEAAPPCLPGMQCWLRRLVLQFQSFRVMGTILQLLGCHRPGWLQHVRTGFVAPSTRGASAWELACRVHCTSLRPQGASIQYAHSLVPSPEFGMAPEDRHLILCILRNPSKMASNQLRFPLLPPHTLATPSFLLRPGRGCAWASCAWPSRAARRPNCLSALRPLCRLALSRVPAGCAAPSRPPRCPAAGISGRAPRRDGHRHLPAQGIRRQLRRVSDGELEFC